jgi:L-rhamnose mutarotase
MPTTTRYFACDLRDDPEAIAAYERYHAPGAAWPAVTESIHRAGILDMRIYRAGNRLFMVMVTDDNRYDPRRKAELDAANPDVQKWESLMETYQQRLPFAAADTKWVELKRIFQL